MIKKLFFCTSLAIYCLFNSPVFAQSTEAKQVYVVQKGDTLSGISKRFNTSMQKVISTNRLQNPNRIYPGQKLIIPVKHPSSSPTITVPDNIGETFIEPVQNVPKKTQVQQEPVETPVRYEASIIVPETEPVLFIEEPIRESRNEHLRRPDHDFLIGGGVTYWLTTFDAKLKVSGEDILGTDIDLENDLGIDTSNGIIVWDVWLQLTSRIRLTVQYTDFSLSGTKDLDDEISFKDYVFPLSTTVTGTLDLQRISVIAELDVLQFSWGYIGLLFGGDYYDLSAKLSATEIGSVSADYKTGDLTIGVKAGIDLPYNFSLYTNIRGLFFDISDVKLHFINFDAGLSYTVFDHVQVALSYRYWWLDVEINDDSGELHLKGPAISAKIRF